MTTTYFISAKGTHNFIQFTKRSVALAYARRCVSDGYEGVTFSIKFPGEPMTIYKIYN